MNNEIPTDKISPELEAINNLRLANRKRYELSEIKSMIYSHRIYIKSNENEIKLLEARAEKLKAEIRELDAKSGWNL